MSKKKKKSNVMNYIVISSFILLNIANIGDIITTKIFTYDFTDFTYETNRCWVLTAMNGYNTLFIYQKIGFYLFLSISLMSLYFLSKNKYLSYAIMLSLVFFTGKIVSVVISNFQFIIVHNLL